MMNAVHKRDSPSTSKAHAGDPWEDAVSMKAEVKVAPKVGMVFTGGGWRPAEQVAPPAPSASAKRTPEGARAALPNPVTKSSLNMPSQPVTAAFARSMAALNVNIAENTARDSHGARDLDAEREAVKWAEVAKVARESEKQRKMAAFNGYAARGGGYVRR
jgi:hypothetical protein